MSDPGHARDTGHAARRAVPASADVREIRHTGVVKIEPGAESGFTSGGPDRTRDAVARIVLECGPQNAAVITGEHAGDIGVFGAGAGGAATAVAAIGDLLTIARDRAAIVPAPLLSAPSIIKGLDRRTHIVDFVGRTEPSFGLIAEAV